MVWVRVGDMGGYGRYGSAGDMGVDEEVEGCGMSGLGAYEDAGGGYEHMDGTYEDMDGSL